MLKLVGTSGTINRRVRLNEVQAAIIKRGSIERGLNAVLPPPKRRSHTTREWVERNRPLFQSWLSEAIAARLKPAEDKSETSSSNRTSSGSSSRSTVSKPKSLLSITGNQTLSKDGEITGKAPVPGRFYRVMTGDRVLMENVKLKDSTVYGHFIEYCFENNQYPYLLDNGRDGLTFEEVQPLEKPRVVHGQEFIFSSDSPNAIGNATQFASLIDGAMYEVSQPSQDHHFTAILDKSLSNNNNMGYPIFRFVGISTYVDVYFGNVTLRAVKG